MKRSKPGIDDSEWVRIHSESKEDVAVAPMNLAGTIRRAQSGDTIIVHNESMKSLGESAIQRMCPEKELIFEVEKRETP